MRPRKLTWFFFVFVLLTGMFSVAMLGFYFLNVKPQQTKNQLKDLLQIKSAAKVLSNDLAKIASDLHVLSQLNELHTGLWNTAAYSEKKQSHKLEQKFITFSAKREMYDQICFIDRNGNETVRVNFNDGDPRKVQPNLLQNKSQRYYFKEAMKLAPGEFYLSPFDLNMENGKIEKPYKPIIRIGAALFDEKGQRKGVLFLNYLGDHLLADFKKITTNIADRVHLVNAQSYWLSSPEVGDEWGFVFNQQLAFANSHPKAWQRILENDSGMFQQEDGFYIFNTVYPTETIKLAKDKSAESSQDVSDSILDMEDPSVFWKIISHSPQIAVANTFPEYVQQNMLILIVIQPLMLLGSLLITLLGIRSWEGRNKHVYYAN